jgi:predicted transposase/invertase (TIGR01784 family)
MRWCWSRSQQLKQAQIAGADSGISQQLAHATTDSLAFRQERDSPVPIKLLDPTIDVVFKLLLLRRQELLRDMIEAVLDLPLPIQELVVQNPEIPKDFPGDKGVVLDIRVRLHNGHQIDLEMQSTVPPGTRARFLYYWAKAFSDSIGIGEDYTLLRPCISILWFKEPVLRGSRFHSIFHLFEDHSHENFSPELEFHVLELPNLNLAGTERQARLDLWARFLRAQSTEELEELAREDAIMTTAKDALQELSSDPVAQRLARERETAVLMHRHLINSSREEGRAEGLVMAVRLACEILDIQLDAAREQLLSSFTCEQLTTLSQKLKAERRWPDSF